MKIDINLAGSVLTDADYAQLRAALVAAQAATPTARAARAAGGAHDAAATLPTFADLLAADTAAGALAHRFAVGADVGAGGVGEHGLNLAVSTFLEADRVEDRRSVRVASGAVTPSQFGDVR